MPSRAPARSARPPGRDWQDSYFSLDERYRRLQKKFNEQEEALKRVKVLRRKEEAPPVGPSLSSVSTRRPSVRLTSRGGNNPVLTSSDGPYNGAADYVSGRSQTSYRNLPSTVGGGVFHSPQHGPPSLSQQSHAAFDHVVSGTLDANGGRGGPFQRSSTSPPPPAAAQEGLSSSFSPHSESQDVDLGHTQEYVAVPSAAGPQAARAAAIAEASAWGSDAALPDPAMVWGTDGQSSLQNYVVASALYHANEELRRKLIESTTTLQTLQQDLAVSRSQHASVQTRLDNAAQQMHQLVRERDLATQKYKNLSHTIADMERTLRDRVAEEEKVRFSMESQITELRSRLVVGADSNELLQKDLRSLLAETRDRTGEVMQLRSKLALAESALSAQRNVNENMLVELKSLNVQLVEERKRLLTITREAQVASLNGTRIADLQEQLQRVQAERNALEHEHVTLMSEFVRVTEDALRHAREEVRTDVADWKAAANHWEQVSQLLYKDIAERTQQHLQCRAECEEVKEQRDTAGLQLRALKDEVALLSAKLNLVWPSHATDTMDLTLEDLQNVFGGKDGQGVFLFDERRRKTLTAAAAAARRRRRREQRAAAVGETDEVESEPSADDAETDELDVHDTFSEDDSLQLAAHLLDDLPADPTTAAGQLRELHVVNAALLSEVRQLRLTNEFLQDRLSCLNGKQKDAQARVEAAEAALQRREKTGYRLLEKQLDRVAFLEAQIKSLRGYNVVPNAPIDALGDNENIFELFLGQLVAAEVPEGVEVPDLFSHVFCSVDFLLHETITTPTVRGLNGFFDVTASFCVSMDTLLVYYLHTRRLLVQLHRVRNEGETTTAITTQEKVTSPEGHADRKQRRGGGGRGSLGGSSVVTNATSSSSSNTTHPSLRMAENMYETIAEGQVSLVDIIASEEFQHAARPTLKGHLRLYTPSKRHIASLEFRLTARRPYTPEFLRVLKDVAEKTIPATTDKGVEASAAAPAGEANSSLLDWVRTTANTSADADLQPLGDPLPPSRASRIDVGLDSAQGHPASSRGCLQHQQQRRDDGTHNTSAILTSRLYQSQMQLVPVADTEDGTSSSSSFLAHQRSHMKETSSALVVHLPAPSPPPSQFSRNVSPWSARLPSSVAWDGEESAGKADTPAPHEPSRASHSPASFVHVDRSLLSQPTSIRGCNESEITRAAITCLWVDVERLELPADLPLPIPRLSCYFSVVPLHKEVWLAAPPTARYTWPYTVDQRGNSIDGNGAGGDFGTPLPVQSVTKLAAAVRAPLVLFFLDADAMASPAPTATTSSPSATHGSSDPCVWAMAVCEWDQAVQHPNVPQSFNLSLIRRDQSVVAGAVVRLTIKATTNITHINNDAETTQAPVAFTSDPATRSGTHAGAATVSSPIAFPPPLTSQPMSAAPPPPLSFSMPGQQRDARCVPPVSSMEEELLQLEYDQRVSRNEN